MKKKINIEKKLDFSKQIEEITAISLDNNLSFIDGSNINGYFIVSGKYKTTLAAQFDEDFSYKIPVEISLTDEVDVNNSKVNITDFIYEISDDKSLLCNIELLIEGVEINVDRECDGESIEKKEIEIPKIDDVETVDVDDNELIETDNNKQNESLNEDAVILNETRDDTEVEDVKPFFDIDGNMETYGTFIVYIVRQNETLNSILSKYNTTLEEVEKYNDIKDISIGSKLIIPLLKDEDK